MPVAFAGEDTVTFMRHPHSESNQIHDLFGKGITHPDEAALVAVHTSERLLTPLGIEQVAAAKDWFAEHWLPYARRDGSAGFTTSYARGIEGAVRLKLPIKWRIDDRLVERNWGKLDRMTFEQRVEMFGHGMNEAEDHAFFWRPENGETMQDVCNRVKDFLTDIRPMAGRHKVIVSHGETMRAFRKLIEQMDIHQYVERVDGGDTRTKSMNCRIIQYAGPSGSGHYDRVRFVNPMAPDDSRTNQDWTPIELDRTYTSEQLLARIASFRHFLRKE